MKYDTFKTILVAVTIFAILFISVISVTIIVKNIKQKKEAERLAIKPVEQEHTIYGDEELGISPEVDEQLKDYRNIALLGIDTAKIEDKEGNRSDAIVIVSIHEKTKDVKIFSVYRDTYLELEDPYRLDKINHAYAFGGKDAALKALNKNLELNIRQVVVLPWDAVSKIVDSMGGVEVEILAGEVAYMNKSLSQGSQIAGPGLQTINGEQAVLYSRIRKDSVEGDLRRNERFKIVLLAAFEKAQNYELNQLISIMNEVLDEVDSNMENVDIVELFLDMSYEIQNSFEWPYEKKGMMYHSVYYLVPVDLEQNVERLHQEVFGQTDYQAGEYVQSVSRSIHEVSGY